MSAMAMDAAEFVLQKLMQCLAALDAVALTVPPTCLVAVAHVEALVNNPDILDDLRRFLPRVM